MVGYGIGDAIAMIAGAMLAMQITDWRAERADRLAADRHGGDAGGRPLWINAELRGTYVIGGASDVAYLVFYLCLFCAPCAISSGNASRAARHSGLQGDLRGSLPIVALMVGTIALLDDRLNLATGQSPLLVWVLVVATLLVVAGQAFATREVVGLHREVATRRFDERLTELVRRSSDMIAICDADGVIRYASPSSEQLLGVAPGELAGQRLDDVLGPEAAHVREVFDQVMRAAHSEQVTTFSIPQADGEKRSFKMVIANLCHVESIRGVTLNIRDISDATRLQRSAAHARVPRFADAARQSLAVLRSRAPGDPARRRRHDAGGAVHRPRQFQDRERQPGAQRGRPLLRSFAHRLVQCTRAGDTVARLGGDEFAVLIDHAPECRGGDGGGAQVLDACKQAFRHRRSPGAHRLPASVWRSRIASATSSGCCAMPTPPCTRPSRAARDTPRFSQPEMLRAARRRMRIENELATAIDSQQLEAHYQPIVDLQSRHLVGVEALMRWRHPTRGLVMPGDFIPLAEETGQIVPMTQWMLNRACADVVRLQRDDRPRRRPARVGQRVEPLSQSRQHRRGRARRRSPRTRLDPDCLILEVTESLLLENSSQLERIFRELKTARRAARAR